MIKYIIWCDERNVNPIVATSKENAIKVFNQETLRYNEEHNCDCMTVAEILEEQPNADFDDFIKGCDFVYCEKFQGTEEEVDLQVKDKINAILDKE